MKATPKVDRPHGTPQVNRPHGAPPSTPTDNRAMMLEAARRLRAAVSRCTAGLQWFAETHRDGRAWIDVDGSSGPTRHAWGMHGFPGEARYAELVDPAAGLLVADLLEDLGNSTLSFGFNARPVRLARQILTGSPDPQPPP